MKKEANAGALTNFEVLDILRSKGASKDPTRFIVRIARSEFKVYDYLVESAGFNKRNTSMSSWKGVKTINLQKLTCSTSSI